MIKIGSIQIPGLFYNYNLFFILLIFFSSSQTSENFQLAIVGPKLQINFSLIFVEFEPDTIPFELQINAENDLAARVYIPPQNSSACIFGALKESSNFILNKKPSNVKLNVTNNEVFIYYLLFFKYKVLYSIGLNFGDLKIFCLNLNMNITAFHINTIIQIFH